MKIKLLALKLKEIIFNSTGVNWRKFMKITSKISDLVKEIKYTQNKYIWMKAVLGIMTTDTEIQKWQWKNVS